MDEYIDVKIDVFDHLGQRARLRKSLTIRTLIEEILKEFEDIAAEIPEKYAIYIEGMDRPLASASMLEQLDIQPHDTLIFKYAWQNQNDQQPLEPHQYAAMRDDSGKIYSIKWQPALIGRPNNDSKHDANLAVNLQSHPKRQTVSRSHAQITFSSGHYYIQPLAENNPIFVEDKKVAFGAHQEINNGDKISIGTKGLQITFFMTRKSATQPSAAALNKQKQVSPPADSPSRQSPVSNERLQSASESAPVTFLVVENAADPSPIGQKIELDTYPSVIGRKIPLLQTEKDVSRQHAEVNYDPATRKFFIKDTGSANGILIDDERLKPNQVYEIQSGIRIRLGPKLVLRFEV